MPAVESGAAQTPGTIRCKGVFVEDSEMEDLETLRVAMESVSGLFACSEESLPGLNTAAILSVFASRLFDIVAVEKPEMVFDMPIFRPQ